MSDSGSRADDGCEAGGGVALGTGNMLEEGMSGTSPAKVTIYHNPN
jgi:hypothetical protein